VRNSEKGSKAVGGMTARKTKSFRARRAPGPIRAAVVRGLTVVVPPLLTIVIFLWIAGTINSYVLEPLTGVARDTIVWSIADIRSKRELPPGEGNLYVEVNNGKTKYIPRAVYDYVRDHKRVESMPASATEIYRRYVELRFLQPYQVVPYFLCGFILVLYLLGKFMAGAAGRLLFGTIERGINRVPLVRNVYSSVKQVSDFIFANRQIQYSRVVAVEWPRKGIWSLALVTGSSLKEVKDKAGEEVLSVLVPTSPMPMTGFTVTVKKSETVDLDITIDEALQFIVSCGVVAPGARLEEALPVAERHAELMATADASEAGSADV
jgi:uncharacterized membrane protein